MSALPSLGIRATFCEHPYQPQQCLMLRRIATSVHEGSKLDVSSLRPRWSIGVMKNVDLLGVGLPSQIPAVAVWTGVKLSCVDGHSRPPWLGANHTGGEAETRPTVNRREVQIETLPA